MSLVDDVTIRVKGGKGGDGSKSFKINYGSMRRVPDGGNGGHGGNVYFIASHNLNDLSEFKYKKEIKAEDGENGKHKNLFGKNGEDIIVKVPLGTTILDNSNSEQVEILDEEEKVLIASGGRKGYGNHDYKIGRNFSPRRDKGEDGEEKELRLILNIIADIGLIGLPNAGKSSFLSKVTHATPKIGDYPFTTTEPNLGVLENLVIADIPGLIEGAHKGKGLGLSFLKHIKKTKMLVHLLDSTSNDILKNYNTVIDELKKFDKNLLTKPQILILSKVDLTDQENLKSAKKQLRDTGKKVYELSIYNEDKVSDIKKTLVNAYKNLEK